MAIDMEWLEKGVFNRALSEEERSAIRSSLTQRKVRAGTRIVKQGQKGGVLFLIRSGLARVQLADENPIDVAKLIEGSIVGEMSFLSDDRASASVIALTDCLLYRLSRDSFTALMNRNEEVAMALFVYILRHSAQVMRNMSEENHHLMRYIWGAARGFPDYAQGAHESTLVDVGGRVESMR